MRRTTLVWIQLFFYYVFVISVYGNYLFGRIAGQLLAIGFLYIALNWLLPLLATCLTEGMLRWSKAAVLVTWLIQYACITATIELRETLVKWSQNWVLRLPRRHIRWVLLLFNSLVLLVYLQSVWLLWRIPQGFTVFVVGTIMLLLVQVWVLCGAAAPMSAKRYWKYFFKLPVEGKNGWHMNEYKTA